MIKSTLEDARRRLGKPVSPKEPLSLELIRSSEYHDIALCWPGACQILIFVISWICRIYEHGGAIRSELNEDLIDDMRGSETRNRSNDTLRTKQKIW